MATEFSRKLSLLRKERGISQRIAAADLGISQALLSHYENGVREPGLAFVVHACDYYHASADFILGRTLSRDGAMLDPDDVLRAAEPKNVLKGSALAMLQGKLLSGAVSVLFELLGKLNDKRIINAAASCLGDMIYRLYRHLYRAAGGNEAVFSANADGFIINAAAAEEQLSETRYVQAMRELVKEKYEFPEVSPDALGKSFPGRSQSMTQVLNSADVRISALTREDD